MSKQLTDIDSASAVATALEDNFLQKYTSSPKMDIHHIGDVTFTNAGVKSDTFNCAIGGSFTRTDSADIAKTVQEYYVSNNLQMAWWVGPSSDEDARHVVLDGAGFQLNETGIGMAAPAMSEGDHLDIILKEDFLVVPVDCLSKFADFVEVLAALFDPVAGEALRSYYSDTAPFYLKPDCPSRLFVGYAGDQPVSTGSLMITERIVGVFDIATAVRYRNRGYGTAMTGTVVKAGRMLGKGLVGLIGTEEGMPMYRKMGFQEVGIFHVYGMKAPAQ